MSIFSRVMAETGGLRVEVEGDRLIMLDGQRRVASTTVANQEEMVGALASEMGARSGPLSSNRFHEVLALASDVVDRAINAAARQSGARRGVCGCACACHDGEESDGWAGPCPVCCNREDPCTCGLDPESYLRGRHDLAQELGASALEVLDGDGNPSAAALLDALRHVAVVVNREKVR